MQLDISRRNDFHPALVRHRSGDYRSGGRRKTGRADGGTTLSWLSLILILAALITFVVGQLLLKKGMGLTNSARAESFRGRFLFLLISGIAAMTISFFLTLGLLQRFDLSYLYPFQGLSVILIAITAAWALREKLTLQVAIGALLITVGVILVSLS